MSSDLAPLDKPAGPPAASIVRVPTKDGPKEVRGKLKRALDLMVYGDEKGNRYDFAEAARTCNYSPRRMRSALERPHVLRYLREQRQVFRQSASAGNIHRALQIRDQDENRTAAIQAIKYLDGLAENERDQAAARGVTPGVVVRVNVNTGPREIADHAIIEVNPLSDNDAVRHDE